MRMFGLSGLVVHQEKTRLVATTSCMQCLGRARVDVPAKAAYAIADMVAIARAVASLTAVPCGCDP